ncbi:MAG: ABC transporter permease [Firmicutes bacterium]|nr:ABC transporter permease [Bacillota bacterium]
MHEKTPLIRLSKREDMPKARVWMIRLGAFIFALLIGMLVFAVAGADPIEAYVTIFKAALGKTTGIRQVVRNAIPLLGTALALAPCFRMRYWNIGAEGQITMGAIAASFFAVHCRNMASLPLLLIMGVGSMVLGGIWSLIPALFKSRWRTNETLFTLMMNYIAIGIAAWLIGGPWEGKPGSQIMPVFSSNAVLPKVLGIQCGWIIVLVLTVVIFVYMRYTKHGYEVQVLGESENTARYAGMNVPKIIMRTAVLSGAICGLVGFLIASGTHGTLYSNVAGGAGFTGITVCWLAQLNPFAMIVIALLLGVLTKGSSTLQTSMAIPASITDIITGIILLCMLGCEFFINYRMHFRENHAKEAK